MAVEFKRFNCKASFINPLKNWALDEQTLELRIDPLLGHVSLYSSSIEDKKEIMFHKLDESFILSVAEATKPNCFLCDGKWEKTTPKYPKDLIKEGRLIRGEVVLFPNLFPIASYHGVIMLGNEHYRSLDNFPEDLLGDAFYVAVEFIKIISSKDKDCRYFTVNANYLPPAGSSVFHPHVQVLGSSVPSTHHERLLEASRQYFEKTKISFWDDLIATEKALGERYIGEFFGSHWIASYSPVGTNEIMGIFPQKGDLSKWEDNEIKALAKGVSLTLKLYKNLEFSTFNFSLFSGTVNNCFPWESSVVRIICRQNFSPNYRTDDYYFQKLMGNEIISTRPEELAKMFRELMARGGF